MVMVTRIFMMVKRRTTLPNYCKCGCGEIAIRNYIHGHNRRKNPKPIPNHHPCECGCGLLISSDKRFSKGHHFVGKHLSKESKEKMSKTMGKTNVLSEVKLRRSSAAKEVISRPGMKEKRIEGLFRPDVRKIALKNATISQNRPEAREKQRESLRRYFADSENRMKQSERIKKTHSNPKVKNIMSEKAKRSWMCQEYVQKQMQARGVKPNKTERKLDTLLNTIYSNEWKFVGDGEIIINGKCPDFINVNSQKKIIELFGDYWHRGQDPDDRKKIFAEFGYDTLVIWEHELKNMDMIKLKIDDFVKKINPYSIHEKIKSKDMVSRRSR